MRCTISAIALAVTISSGNAAAMELNTALHLVKAWGQDSKDMTLIGRMTVDAHGDFLTKSAGAFFRYDSAKKQLLVSGLVSYNDQLHSEFPDTWEKLLRAGKRESATLGEGEFELYKRELFGLAPNVILLTKAFRDDSIKQTQFVTEVDWLLKGAYYWLMKRYNDVLVTPERDLIVQGQKLNDEMLKARPRPW